MNKMTPSQFEPSTRAAQTAASIFLEKMDSWKEARRNAMGGLRRTCSDVSGKARPLGFVSRDPLDMSVVGVVFDSPPESGFVPAPSRLAASALRDGARGLVYIPDTQTPTGQRVMKSMRALSSVCEQRPLLQIPGVQAVTLAGNSLCITAAVKMANGSVKIIAPETAIKSYANVAPVSAAVPSASASSAPVPTEAAARVVQRGLRPRPEGLDS